jgi:hypothetical protein
MKGLTTSNSLEEERLSSNIRAIELHLERLHEECMYLEAAKVQEELQKLKAERHAQNTTYWVDRHDKTIAGLRQQRELLFSAAQQRMDIQLREVHKRLETDKREMQRRHAMEIQTLRKSIEMHELERNRTTRPNSPSQKFSGKVLALLEKEKRLARSRFYERAAKARKDAEKLMAIENENRKLSDFRLRQGKLSKLVNTHKEERIALQSNFEHERRKLVANCRRDQKRITVRVRKTRSDLSRARSLRVAMGTSSSPVLFDAAEKASRKGEQSAATLPLTASPLRNDRTRSTETGSRSGSPTNSGRARPRSAHSSRRKKRPSSAYGGNSKKREGLLVRPSTAPPKRRSTNTTIANSIAPAEGEKVRVAVGANAPVDTTPVNAAPADEKVEEERIEKEDVEEIHEDNEGNEEDDDYQNRKGYHRINKSTKANRRSKSAGRRRRPKSAGGRWRGGRRRRKNKISCWWCSESDGHISKSGGVSIPSSSNPRKGTGKFCSWECASSHVFKYFPIQDRWISDLLIQDAAGYLVRKSTRPHRRPQGPGIPSMDM